jgi:hypothetical protein
VNPCAGHVARVRVAAHHSELLLLAHLETVSSANNLLMAACGRGRRKSAKKNVSRSTSC